MATLQVRSIDDDLYKALGRRAAMDNRSISQEVVAILKAFLSSPKAQHTNATTDFLSMCGTWVDEKSSDQIVRELRQSRTKNDRFKELF